MNYRQLQRSINRQQEWADELARYQRRNDREPADSQRWLLAQDDRQAD